MSDIHNFYPRPPRGGRLQVAAVLMVRHDISIHALREEGDFYSTSTRNVKNEFLSTPSARRATPASAARERGSQISIHALREEGDNSRQMERIA